MAYATAREVAPLIAALHGRADEIRDTELERFAGRLERPVAQRTRSGRSARARRHRQDVVPPDGASQRRGRHRTRRTSRRRDARSVRSVTTPRLRIATRGSALARWQAEHVAATADDSDATRAAIEDRSRPHRDHRRSSSRSLDRTAWAARACSSRRSRRRCLDGRADLAVHSAKDLPSLTVDGLVLASITERADPRDVLVGARYDALPNGAHIATGSARRRRAARLSSARSSLQRSAGQHRHAAREMLVVRCDRDGQGGARSTRARSFVRSAPCPPSSTSSTLQ